MVGRPRRRKRALEKARFEAAPKDGKLRRFKEFFDGAASWSRVERIIARVEVGAEGPDTRFVVTNLKITNARVLYEDVYFRHGGVYWLMWGLRASVPKRSMCRVAQFDPLRLRLIKVAARVVEMKTMIKIHLPASCPAQDILRLVLGHIPRLVTLATGRRAPKIEPV